MIELPTRIIRFDRCELCNEKQSYVIRDNNVNTSLTNADIYFIIANHEKTKYDYCEHCDCRTLKTTIAWHGVK